jgi:hypothetical protein
MWSCRSNSGLDPGFTHCPPFGRSALASLEAASFVPNRTVRFELSLVTFGHVSLRSTRLRWMKLGYFGSTEFWTYFGYPKLNIPLLETTPYYEGATGGHAVSVFRFSSLTPTEGPVRRAVLGFGVASVSVAPSCFELGISSPLVVLMANPVGLIAALLALSIYPASVRDVLSSCELPSR